MTALLEKVISIIAPHSCIVCSNENNILCEACQQQVFVGMPEVCVFCQKPTVNWQTCIKCSRKYKIDSIWVAGEYKDEIAKLLKLYKFERLKAARIPLAAVLNDLMPYTAPNVLVVPLPTPPSRVRQRGYDQSVLIAQELARLRNLKMAKLITRQHASRQVGASRQERFLQASKAYSLKTEPIKGKVIWLVDDVCTTGASLSAAAKLLKSAGAKEVHGVVVGWRKLWG